MIVKARLQGHPFDLQALAELLPCGETRVLHDDEGYYLTATEIDNRPVGVPFYEVAQLVLDRVNGLARVKSAGYNPVRLSGQYQEGEQRHHVVQPDSVMIRVRVSPATVQVDGQPVAPLPPPDPAYASLAASNHDVSEALAIMGRQEPPNWSELYKVYEIIEHTGHLKGAMDAAGILRSKEKLFRRTANHPDASGPDARHGRLTADPPQNPMPLREARDLTRDLVRAWMDLLQRENLSSR